jgi:hypothetical protein
MARIAFLVLGLAAGFLAAWVLRGPDAPARGGPRPAERLNDTPTRGERPEHAQPEEQPAGAAAPPRVRTTSTREALREVHKAQHENQEPAKDLLDAAADEVDRAVERYREQMIRSLGGRLHWREELRRKIGEISDSPLVLQGRTVRRLRLEPTSGQHRDRQRSALVDVPLDPRTPVRRDEHQAYVRGGAVPPGRTFVVEGIRVVATLASDLPAGDIRARRERPHLELRVDRDKPLIWNGPPTPFEVELRGRAHLLHGGEHRISMELRHGAASIELHGRLLPVAEAYELPAVPFAAHTGHGILDGEPVLLQVFAQHGGGNPNTITLDGRVNMYVQAVSPTNLWSDTADVGQQRTSLAYGRGVGRVPAGKVFVVRRIEYRARLNKRDGSHSDFEITVGGKKVVKVTAAQEANPAGAWVGEVAVRPGEEKRVALTASMHALAEAIILGDVVTDEG